MSEKKKEVNTSVTLATKKTSGIEGNTKTSIKYEVITSVKITK